MVHFQNCLDNPAFNQRWPLLVKIEISLKLSFLIHFLFDYRYEFVCPCDKESGVNSYVPLTLCHRGIQTHYDIPTI
jgi:hypothetical protein